jgi:hypothetical protein
MKWSEFEHVVPELASLGRERFTARNVMVLGTLRADGSPRISPINPFFVGGELLIGSMRSGKVSDLKRDPRCALHSAIFDGDGSDGEFKLFGKAIEVTDPMLRAADPSAWWTKYPTDKASVFAIDIASAAFVNWDWAAGTYETLSWSTGGATKREVRGYP